MREAAPLYAGLSWNAAACFQIADLLATGVTGGRTVEVNGRGGTTDWAFTLGVAAFELRRSEECIAGCWSVSSSGSTNSSSLSAALSACSARARIASSMIG